MADVNKLGTKKEPVLVRGGASMDSASSSPQSDNRSSSPSKGEAVELKADNSCIPTRGTSKKGTDFGFNDVQICNCLNKTAAAMSSMLMAANSVRAAACEKECGYISSEKEKKTKVDNQILEADAACKEKLEQIRRRWQDLMLCKAPQELAQHISEQCKACDALIDSKKSFAEMIRAELKAVDEDYHRMFRQQAKDVDVLVMSMGTQVLDLHDTHIEELCTIETDFQTQRKEMLLRNKADIEALLKRVRNTENLLKEDLSKRIEDYTKSLENIRTQDNEDYNLLKVRLETDIQILEQHLESMSAAYQLNTEKLDYNYAVLVERDHDNYVTAGQQKRKLTKQRDTLCTLKGRHYDYEKRFLLQNGKLSNDYEKILRLLQDLQSKEHQLETAQQKQHWEFVCMHHHSLAVLASKLLQADKKIHEEQLGWFWCPPPKEFFLSLGSLISSKKRGQAKHPQIESESCRGSSGLRDNMLGLRLNGQTNGDDNMDQESVRFSQDELAISQNKSLELPDIPEIKRIWMSYSELIAPKVLRVWASLAAALVSYNQLLKNRGKLMHEVFHLSQEKKLLQGALNHCLSSKASKRR